MKNRFHLANYSNKAIHKLNKEQEADLYNSLNTEAEKWRKCFNWNDKKAHQAGPSFEADEFGLPKQQQKS